MNFYNIALATDWEYDQDFIQLLENIAQQKNLSTYIIYPDNLNETIQLFQKGEIKFNYMIDRASDTSPEFIILQNLLYNNGVSILDRWHTLKWASNKATMHRLLSSSFIPLPKTIILRPYSIDDNIIFSENELSHIGIPFIIKPADTKGGGIGVIKNAETIKEICNTRKEFPNESYLIQKKIIPKEKDNNRFWFRGFNACGLVKAVWWNDQLSIYNILNQEDIKKYNLFLIFDIIKKIAQICNVNFFSTEIACDEEGDFFVIDYVNEVCDMRLKSKHSDGVPDEIVREIADWIIEYIEKV